VSKKEKFLASAQKNLSRGALDKALADFKVAAEDDPKDARTWLRIADLHVKRGKKDEATAVYMNTAQIYTEQGFFQKAVAVFKNVLKLSPGLVDAHFKLADLYRQLGLLSDAMQQYELAAAVYQKAGQTKEAMGAMRRIVDINPEHVLSRIKLAEAASRANLKDEAIAEFRKAVEQLKGQGKTDEFLRVGERLLAHLPDDLAFSREMAEGYLERGNGRFALAKLQPCFAANPRDLEILELLVRAFEQLGQIQKTVSVLKEIGRIRREQKNDDEAEASYERVLALDPSDVEAKNELARLKASRSSPMMARPHTPGPAITFSEMAVPPFLAARESSPNMQSGPNLAVEAQAAQRSLDPPHAAADRIVAEADIFMKYALLDRAVDHLRKVFDLVPDHVGARERLAQALLDLGRRSEAATQFALLSEQMRRRDPQRSSEYAQRASDVRPRGERVPEPDTFSDTRGTNPEMVPILPADATDELMEAEEIMELDEVDGEVVDGGGVLKTEKFGAYSGPPVASRTTSDPGDWHGKTSMDTALPPVDEFARVERTHAEEGDAALAADLEQVDFFIDQELMDDARTVLEDLVGRYPGHPAIKEREDRMNAFRAAPSSLGMPKAMVSGGGSPDANTHRDLGVAYMDMGLFDAAIKEFRTLANDAKHEVYALTMIGQCHEKKGALAEAVIHFKKALNRPGVAPEASNELYYRLGHVFEALGDGNEALYFFEKVTKRDADFRDAKARIARLKAAGPVLPKPREEAH
jgi:tetratricopeptide (TPR) repeat protein